MRYVSRAAAAFAEPPVPSALGFHSSPRAQTTQPSTHARASRAALEAIGFRVRRLPVGCGFLLALFRVPLVMRGPGQDHQLTPARFCVDFIFFIARRHHAAHKEGGEAHTT